MSHPLLDAYAKAEKSILDHVGYEHGWAVYPIDDLTDYPWAIHENELYYWNEDFLLYTAPMLYINGKNKICKGSELSLVVMDTQTDGNVFLGILDNNKYCTTMPEEVLTQI